MSTGGRMPRTQRRAQLLAIATESFTQAGFEAVAMDDIARRAGVTKPVLYQHFRSKQDLYLAVVEEVGGRLLAGAEHLSTAPGDTYERAREALGRFWELTYPAAALRLFTRSAQPSEEISRRIDEILDEVARIISSVLLRSREIDEDGARVLGRTLLATAQSTAALLATTEDPAERARVLDTVTRLVVGGLLDFAPLPEPGVAGEVTAAERDTDRPRRR